MDGTTITRRTALATAASTGCALFLAACSSSAKTDDPTVTTPAGTTPAGSGATTSGAATSTATSAAVPSGAATSPAADVLAPLSAVPVGGAIAVSDGTVLLSQPTPGKVVGLNATCPHMGSLVQVKGADFECPNHHSRFKLADGSLINGPATSGLKTVNVSVVGGNVVRT